MSSDIRITLTLSDPKLGGEEIQAVVQRLIPLVKDVDGVENACLVSTDTSPKGAKGGNLLVGTFEVTTKIAKLRPLWQFLQRILQGKTIEATFKSPNGKEFTAKVTNREDFEYLRQQAEEFFK